MFTTSGLPEITHGNSRSVYDVKYIMHTLTLSQSQLPEGATLLGVILSSDKTNISVMSGNRMAHPLLLSLANIDANICSKGSLHGFLLLALLPVASFIHNKSRVQSLLSDCLIHQCLDLVLEPLKVAAAIGVMMSDPVGNLRHCHTPLVAYITDMPEQSLIACTSPKVSPVSTAIYKDFGDGIHHPPRMATDTIGVIKTMCTKSPQTDLLEFLKAAKTHRLNGVFEPFWRNYFSSEPSKFLLPEILHHFHCFFFDHDLQWCIGAVGSEELDYRFTLIQTPVGYHSFSEGVSKLKQVTGRDHRAIQCYIIGIVAGAIAPQFLTAIRSLMDFRYLAQMPLFDEGVLIKITAAMQSFHNNKEAIISAGGRSHFEIPKLELLQHVVPSIRVLGVLVLVISTSSYYPISSYQGLPYLPSTCCNFIALL